MNSTIYIHNYLTTCPQRCLGKIKLLFSLNHKLQMRLNGKNITLNQALVLINHNDIYEILHAEHLIEVNIPLCHFNTIDDAFFNYHYNYKLIQSADYIKHFILNIVAKLSHQEPIKYSNLTELIRLLNDEASVNSDTQYLPKITTESALLNSITKFIDSNATNSISSKDITAVFYVTAPYISILFKKYLGISFKHYVSSLKIGLSFKPLFQSNEAIHTISEVLGFNHYASYTQQFKNFLADTPNMLRKKFMLSNHSSIQLINKDEMDLTSYFEHLPSFTAAHNQTDHIDLNHLIYNDKTKFPTIFIHADDLIEIMQSNLIAKLNFHDIAEVYLLINNIGYFNLERLNLLAIIDFIDSLFLQNVRLGLRIKTFTEYKMIESMIIQVFNYKPEYYRQRFMRYFLLLLDTEHLSLKEIHDIYISAHNLEVKVKLAITIEGAIKQTKSITKTFDYLSHYAYDYYFIDIESENTRQCLTKYSNAFDQTMTFLDCFNKVIDITSIHKSKFVYAHVSKHCFKLYDEHAPLALSDLMCHMLIMIKQGSGVGYKLIKSATSDLSLMNKHYMYEPLMYLYQFLKPFINKPLALENNLLAVKDKYCTHLLLFNSTEHTISPQMPKKFTFIYPDITTMLTIFIQTLNRNHGYIDFSLPPTLNAMGIDKKLLNYIEQSSYPKSELKQLEYKNQPIAFELHHNEIKYICISRN